MDFSNTPEAIERVIMFVDIRHSTAIMEDLVAASAVSRWTGLIDLVRDTLQAESDKLNFEIYKFLGDGWILIFEVCGQTPANVFRTLRIIDLMWSVGYEESIEPVLRTHQDETGLTFGVTLGRVHRWNMQGQIEYVGAAINEASRLQALASSISDPLTIGYLDTAFYSRFEYHLEDRVGRDRRPMKNVAGGKEVALYILDILRFKEDTAFDGPTYE